MKRPSRLSWFRLDVDAFLDDPRMQEFTNKERAAWALMLIRSFRNKGEIITNPYVVAEQTGLSKREAEELITKLYEEELIIPDTGRSYRATSPRLREEYQKARESYDRYSGMGQSSAEKHGDTNLRRVK